MKILIVKNTYLHKHVYRNKRHGHRLFRSEQATYPAPDFMAQIFLADLLSIKTVSGAKVGWCRWCGCIFYVGDLALSLKQLCLQWSKADRSSCRTTRMALSAAASSG